MNENTTDNTRPDDLTQPILVSYTIDETPDQRKARQAQGLPTPTYSFMCRRVEDGK